MKKLSNTEADFKKALLIKKRVLPAYYYAFFQDKYVSRSFAVTFEIISHKKVLLYDSCHMELQTFSMNLLTKKFS